jgi:hypothetical protein
LRHRPPRLPAAGRPKRMLRVCRPRSRTSHRRRQPRPLLGRR